MYEPIVTPKDSRYVPFTQQPSCCVPTAIQMIMYRHNIPLIPAEELGYHLGLTVSPEREHLFYKPRVAQTAPRAGYGTQVDSPEFEPNVVFKKLGIPLVFSITSIADISSSEELLVLLQDVEKSDKDALLCFNRGVLTDDPTQNNGHVCVFDRIIDGKIRIIDSSPHQPKWRLVEASKMCEAMTKHPTPESAGIWHFDMHKS